MPLFVCSKCNGIDNTATAAGGYWLEKIKLCAECKTGQWHGRFIQTQYDEKADGPMGPGRLIGEYWGKR